MASRAAVILAAGQGSRMKSSLPKVLHTVGGRAMIDWSIALAQQAGCDPVMVVLNKSQDALIEHVKTALGGDAIAFQDEPLGTGHAALAAKARLSGHTGATVVLYGDTPLIRPESIDALLEGAEAAPSIGVLGFAAKDAGAYGRLIMSESSAGLERIVEAKEASPDELAVNLCNSGVMAARTSDLFACLDDVRNDNAKGEYYLTDIVEIGRQRGLSAQAVTCDEADVLGVNSRVELAAAEASFQARARVEAMTNGVTLRDPDTVYFSHDTILEPDVEVEPNVVFAAGVKVHSGARIRAFSHLEGATVMAGAEVGPYARLRPGTEIGERAKIGNFVEVKNTKLGIGAKANHLSYLGDGEVGSGANIGAGTIFCNYDGFFKYKTIIGENAFIGSNSALVAPVEIGAGAMVGSGSVVTQNVESDALALGRAKQSSKPGWAARFRKLMQEKKNGS